MPPRRPEPTSAPEPVAPIPLVSTRDGVTFAVRVVPRAGRTGIGGTRGDALLVRLAAAPVDGAANDALLALFADLLDRPKRDIVLVSGHASRDKRVMVVGVSPVDLTARLSAILAKTARSRAIT